MAKNIEDIFPLVFNEDGKIVRKTDGKIFHNTAVVILKEKPMTLVVGENYCPESNRFDNLGEIPAEAEGILLGDSFRYRLNSQHNNEVFSGVYCRVLESD